MQRSLGQAHDPAPARAGQEGAAKNGDRPGIKEIPYDYVATFVLEGRRGNRVQDVINISVDGAFVAVAIGYSFIPAVPEPALPGVGVTAAQASRDPCSPAQAAGIDFKYSIIDSGSGRELQNKPIHNIAGLGEPTGQRPFRPLAKAITFMPRSTIRIEVEEISVGPIYGYDGTSGRRIGAELQIVLHGYKILGYGTGLP